MSGCLVFVKRLFSFAEQYLLRRSLPHGIISWRYLLPNPPPKVRIHRHLWLLGRPPRIPFALFFLIEFVLWMRWVTFAGWRRSWRAAQHWGAAIEDREGISKALQLKHVLFMSLCHCIPPSEIYAFGLYRCRTKQELWDYVYTLELPAFHRWRNARPGESRESSSLLQDKFGLTNLLVAHGVPMAPVLGVISRGTPFDPAPYLQTCLRLFCKPRHGSGSRDAFVIECRDEETRAAIFAVKSGMKEEPSSLDALQKAIGRDDFLVQPVMANHPLLAPLSPTEDAVTLRIITEQHPARGTCCYNATLEIPNYSDGHGYFHIILPIELSSGVVMRFPEQRLPAAAQSRHDALHARMGRLAVPYWEEMKKSAIIAHQCFTDVYAIAWDYVITPTGPCMLEGNSGWGTTTPQILLGGLLLNEIREN